MFKKLERAWNARTPEYLHNGTKANIIWQLKISAVLLVAMLAWDEYKFRQERKNLKKFDGETVQD